MRTPENCTVLVVDDEEIVRKAVRSVLHKWGFKTVLVGNACDAMRESLDRPPDAVLLDMNLGSLVDGIHLGSQFMHLGCPIIYMTGFNYPHVRERAMQNKPAAFLVKPFEMVELKRALKTAIPKLQITPTKRVRL